MRSITKLFMLTLFLGSNTLFAQLVGEFNHAPDRHIYFYLTNLTGYQIPVAYGVSNFEKNEHRQYSGVMLPYGTFMFGPNMNWRWEKGEVFIIVYQNGQIVQWTCPETDPPTYNPTFKHKLEDESRICPNQPNKNQHFTTIKEGNIIATSDICMFCKHSWFDHRKK